MPSARRTLGGEAAEQLCAALFAPATAQRVGLELEWSLHRREDQDARVTAGDMAFAQRRQLPAGSRITFEPGGQVELSSRPYPTLAQLFTAMHGDELALRSHLAAAGWVMGGAPVDERRSPRRVLANARYAAMEQFFAAQGSSGAWMMCNTASTQINISNDGDDPAGRWRTMQLIAPVLVATFANSPGLSPGGARWASLRQGIWWGIDPGRTRAVPAGSSPAKAWLDYALAADVMFVNHSGSSGTEGTAVPPGLPFGRWLRDGHELGWPTTQDLRYHLTTLFPPVRPRGWLELRVLDALPEWMRQVATLVVTASATAAAGRDLCARMPDTGSWWLPAARYGLGHPGIARAARTLFAVAAGHLDAVTDDAEHRSLLTCFRTQYVDRARTPGDDRSPADLRRYAPVLM